MATELWAASLVLFACLIGSFGPIYLKKSSKAFAFSIKGTILNRNLIIGIISYGFGTILFIPALKGGDLSVLYPLVGTVYIWVSLLSIKMLKEKMNSMKWAGIAIIIVGVALIGLGA